MESERRQATRWIQAAAYVRTGKFNEEEAWFVLSLFYYVYLCLLLIYGVNLYVQLFQVHLSVGISKTRFWMVADVAGDDP